MQECIGVYIGKRVLELREHRDLTQKELAEASGVPQPNISRLERGVLDDINVSTLLGLAHALRVKPQTLLPERTPAPARATHPRPRRKRPAPAAGEQEEAA